MAMTEISIVCGERTDDIVASALMYKFLTALEADVETPYFTPNVQQPAHQSPFIRTRVYTQQPTMFIGVPIDTVAMESWRDFWIKSKVSRRLAEFLNVFCVPFIIDNHLSSFNTFRETTGALVIEGESLSALTYDYISQIHNACLCQATGDGTYYGIPVENIDFAEYRSLTYKLGKSVNLDTYDENAKKINVLPYLYHPAYIFEQIVKDGKWIDKVLASEEVEEFIEIQKTRIVALMKGVQSEKIENLNFGFYTDMKKPLYIEDTENFCAELLKNGRLAGGKITELPPQDVVIAFRKDMGVSDKGCVIEVRTKMGEARNLVNIISSLFFKENYEAVINTKNRGQIYLYNKRLAVKPPTLEGNKSKGNRGGKLLSAIIAQLAVRLREQTYTGQLTNEYAQIGY